MVVHLLQKDCKCINTIPHLECSVSKIASISSILYHLLVIINIKDGLSETREVLKKNLIKVGY